MKLLKLILIPLGVVMVLVGMILLMSELILAGCGLMGFSAVVGSTTVGDLDARYDWGHDEPYDKPTRLSKLIEAYMKQDPLDPSSTINFLMEVEALENPFAAPVLQPKIQPPRKATAMDDLVQSVAVTYGVPTHSLQCRSCRKIGSFSGGRCHACGGRATHPSWAIWSGWGAVDYYDKRKMEADAYQLQKEGKKITIFDSNGKQLFVAPPPRSIDDIREAYGRKRKHPRRDARGRFCKAPEPISASYDAYVKEELERQYAKQSIHPLDEPYPIEMVHPESSWPKIPSLPGRTIRD